MRLSSLTNPSTPGQPVAFEADTFTPPGDAYAVGDVEFFDNGTTLLGVSQLDGTGTAVLIAPLVAGTHSITAQYEGGGVFGGSTSDPLIQTVAALTPSQRFVDQLFNDILGRPNTDTSWASAIDRHQVSRTQVAAALSTSTENVTNEVQAMYWAHLGRAADPAGLAYWVGYIQQGRGTAEELEESFLGTPEYFADSGGTADTFMRAIFQDVLGRQPDAGGRAYWDARIASGTPTWVVAASVVMSTEAMRTRVTNDFWQILWRAPDAGGLAYWSRALQGGVHDEMLIAGLAGSVEYWQKTQH